VLQDSLKRKLSGAIVTYCKVGDLSEM